MMYIRVCFSDLLDMFFFYMFVNWNLIKTHGKYFTGLSKLLEDVTKGD